MISDDERRDVAARLRELHLNPWDDAACGIAQCVGIACCNSECHGSDEEPECTMALASQLADLIEPAPERTCKVVQMDDAGNPPWNQSGLALDSITIGCSECGYPFRIRGREFRFCPNCGAKVVE